MLNPKYVKKFAESLPRRSKTDALDADVLLRFARERQPSCWTPPPAGYHELRQRLMARDALLEMRQQARNQQHALSQWPVVVAAVTNRFDAVISNLDEQLATLDQEITTVLHAGAWAASAALLLSIPGIGIQATAWLLVTTFNFTLCDTPEAVVAYAGLSPLERESGTSIRGRPHVGRGGLGHSTCRTCGKQFLPTPLETSVRVARPALACYDQLPTRIIGGATDGCCPRLSAAATAVYRPHPVRLRGDSPDLVGGPDDC